MKKLFIATQIIITFSIPVLLYAASQTMTITWTIADTTNVQGYRVYFADNSSMVGKTLHDDCLAPVENPINTFTITCHNIDLEDNNTNYLAIAAVKGDTEISSDPEDIIYITPVQNFRITTINQP